MTERDPSLSALCGATLLAAVLFVPLFILHGFGPLDFWWAMTLVNVVLFATAATVDPGFLPSLVADVKEGLAAKLALGLGSAALLYGVFFVGNVISRWIIPGAGEGIDAVYQLKSTASLWRIGLLMAFVFGPGEELIWRGFLQRCWANRLGPWRGYLAAAALYALVHAGSLNFMLIMAALVCGLYWGLLYLWKRSMVVNVVSHTAWDLAIFLLIPV